MDYCHSNTSPFFLNKSAVKSSAAGLHRLVLSSGRKNRQVPSSVYFSGSRRPSVAVARAGASSNCEFSSLNTPLEPKSAPGKYLSRLLLNDDAEVFQDAVCKQLEKLAADRDDAIRRAGSSVSSDEACLHRFEFLNSKIPEAAGSIGGSLERESLKMILSENHFLHSTPTNWHSGSLALRLQYNRYIALTYFALERIAELREQECQIAVEDIMYTLVLHKFHKIKVHLVPRLSKCIYNHRLELWPSNDWELESIHSFEVLELIREHLTVVIGWKANSNITDNWATTEIPRLQLCRIYAASILYGYFLKSAALRHRLELNLGLTCQNPLLVPELLSCGMKNIAFGRIGRAQSASQGLESCIRVKKRENLKCYVMQLDPKTLEMFAKPKTREAVSLVEKHSCALFGDEETGLVETNEVIVTSLSSLKRMVLEAVAFGSFLWETEEYVDAVHKLKEV